MPIAQARQSVAAEARPRAQGRQPLAHAALTARATVLELGDRVRLAFVLGRSCARDCVIGAGSEIDENVVEITHDIAICAERRHDALLRRVDVLASVDHDIREVGVAERLQRFAEPRSIGRSFAVGAVAHVALRMVAAIARIGVPVHRPVALHLVGGIAVLVVVLAVFALDRRGIARRGRARCRRRPRTRGRPAR